MSGRSLHWRGTAALALFTAALVGVAGCGSAETAARPPCPSVAILGDAAALTRFASGAGQDLVDVDFHVEIVDLLAGCRYVTADQGERTIVTDLAPVFLASRGPANRSREASFTYFVSIVGGGRDILGKQSFAFAVAFPGNLSRVEVQDDRPPITINIPLPSGRDASAYEILVGLQLTADELDYNRMSPTGLR